MFLTSSVYDDPPLEGEPEGVSLQFLPSRGSQRGSFLSSPPWVGYGGISSNFMCDNATMRHFPTYLADYQYIRICPAFLGGMDRFFDCLYINRYWITEATFPLPSLSQLLPHSLSHCPIVPHNLYWIRIMIFYGF